VQETNAELENLVQTRTQELRKAYIELDTFFYRASHDFRRPITTFLGLAEVAKMTIKDQAALELFANVRDTAKSLDRMIIKLNAVSDIGSHQLVYKEVQLNEIVQDVLEVFQDKIRNGDIEIVNHIKSDRQVLSYPALVRIIIENLVENSIDFRIPENPMIEITTQTDDESIIFIVKDNGQGVDEEYLPKIFEMYFRGNVNSKGNGLGLYVVKKAIDKIGAHINFESQKYMGTTVTITFPLNANPMRGIS
jgi:signal transduction histidine kinase